MYTGTTMTVVCVHIASTHNEHQSLTYTQPSETFPPSLCLRCLRQQRLFHSVLSRRAIALTRPTRFWW